MTSAVREQLVLVVEDDALLRTVACDMLEDAGYPTLSAGDADEAIRLLEGRSDIRVVFSDIQMPGSLDGVKLAHAVRKRWPPVEVILTSGRARPTPAELPARVTYLHKPFASADLIAAIEKLAA